MIHLTKKPMLKRYHISKGKHRSTWFPKFFFTKKNYVKVHFVFTEDFFVDAGNQQINKIGGVSFGFNHHKNSFRVGWRTINDIVEIIRYSYINGQRFEDVVYRLTKKDLGKSVSIKMNIAKKYGYFLFPYFGGKTKAPKNLSFLTSISFT